MLHHQKRYRINTKKKVKKVDKGLKNVVSLRITDQEKETLEKLTKTSSRNVSDVVREAISFWLAMRETVCLRS